MGHALGLTLRVGDEELGDDLGGVEVTIESHRPRQAKRAPEPATDLRRQAQRETVFVGHEHGTDPSAVAQAKDQLPAAVQRRRDTLDLRQRHLGTLGERSAELPGQIRHRLEVEDALPVEPGGELTAAIPRCTELDREVFHLGREEANQIDAGHRWEE